MPVAVQRPMWELPPGGLASSGSLSGLSYRLVQHHLNTLPDLPEPQVL